MTKSVQIQLPPMEVKAIVPARDRQDNELVLVRRCLREAITESGWKHEAVAAEMTRNGAKVDPPYLSKMLNGGPDGKSISALHLRALPDDIEAIYARKYAESFGLIVVAPVSGDQAVRNLVSGLVGVLSQKVA